MNEKRGLRININNSTFETDRVARRNLIRTEKFRLASPTVKICIWVSIYLGNFLAVDDFELLPHLVSYGHSSLDGTTRVILNVLFRATLCYDVSLFISLRIK